MTGFKPNLVVVGGFVLVALVSLVLSLAILAGRTGPTDRYYTVYPNVAGLKFGAQVVFEGYPVGQVESIEPLEENGRPQFRVEMSVKSGWKIPDDSVATPESSGVLAPVIIAIAAGRSARTLAPGDRIPPGQSGGWLASLSSVAGNVDQLTGKALLPLVDNMNRQVTLLGEVVEKDLRPLAANANRLVAQTAQHWPVIMANADRVSGDLAGVSAQLGGLLDEDRVASLDRLIGNLDRAAQDLQQTSAALQSLTHDSGKDLKAGVQEFRYVMESLSRNAESFSQNLATTSLNLQDFSRQIRQNPGVLLRAPEPADDPVPPLRARQP